MNDEELLENISIKIEDLIALVEGYGPHNEIEQELRDILIMVNTGLGYGEEEE